MGYTGSKGDIGFTGSQGDTGFTGSQGTQGQPGQSDSLYNYRAKTTITSGDPGAGHVIWNNATQASATELIFSHLDDIGNDIEYLLGLILPGDVIRIQDQDVSENFQTWVVNGTVTVTVDSRVQVPVSLTTSTYSFSNNEQLIAVIRSAGVQGYTGSQGAIGFTGSRGADGPGADQSLNTTSNVIFNSVVTQDVVSAGGFPVNSSGLALIATANTQSPALVVSNYTSGIFPSAVVRGYGQNFPGTVSTTTMGTAQLFLEGSRGTHTAPTAVQNGAGLGVVNFGGYDGTRWSTEHFNPVRFVTLATENWAGNATTATNAGARWFIQSQPLGIQLNSTSRHFDILTSQTAGSSSAPPTHSLLLGQADNAFATLTMSNGIDSHSGHGATSILSINSKHQIIGVPFEDAAVFTADISGTTMTVSAVSSGILSTGQRVYATGVTSGTFITALVTGAGGTGTYTITPSQTVSSMTMNSGADNTTLNDSVAVTFVSGRKNGVAARRNSLKTGDTVGRISFNGQTANLQSGTGSRVSNIRVDALENFSGSARGSRMLFTSVNSGTTTEATRLELKNLQNLYYSNSHYFADAAGSAPFLQIDTNGATFGNGSATAIISSAGTNDLQLTTNHPAGTRGTLALTDDQIQLYVGSEVAFEVNATNANFARDNIVLNNDAGTTQMASFSTSSVNLNIGNANAILLNTTENVYTNENHKFTDSLSTVRAEFRKDYSHSDTDLFEVRNADGTDIVAAFTTNSIDVGTHILPDTDSAYDLGSSTKKWRSLYVSTSTIYIDDFAVSVANGQLTINGSPQVVYSG